MHMNEIRWGILQALSDGAPAARKAILAGIGVDKLPGWPFTKLMEGGLIVRQARGIYSITDAGREALMRRLSQPGTDWEHGHSNGGKDPSSV